MNTQNSDPSTEALTKGFNLISKGANTVAQIFLFLCLLTVHFPHTAGKLPVTSVTTDRQFEFVLLRSAALDRTVDSTAFASHFTEGDDVVTFPNLGGDAVMVVPCPVVADSIYGHLASFIRNAPPTQVHHVWQSVGDAMQQRLGDRPVWLSTAGMGVSWLHVRLDSRPKYYGHAPFKQVAP